MKYIIGAIVVLGVIVGGAMVLGNTKQDKKGEMVKDTNVVLDEVTEEPVEVEGEVVEVLEQADTITEENRAEDVSEVQGSAEEATTENTNNETGVSQATPGVFTDFSEARLADASGSIVLSFTADWCPSCRALESDINASLSEIPSDLTILDIDFDDSSELRKKYGVTTQHTLVQVDNQGNMIQTWRGGNTLASIVAQVS